MYKFEIFTHSLQGLHTKPIKGHQPFLHEEKIIIKGGKKKKITISNHLKIMPGNASVNHIPLCCIQRYVGIHFFHLCLL